MSAVGVPEDPGVEWGGITHDPMCFATLTHREEPDEYMGCVCGIGDPEPEPRPARDWREQYHADWKTSREAHR